MNIEDLYLDQDQSAYSINMICIYILVLLVAFIVCVIISQKLNVYATSYKKEIQYKFSTKSHTGNEILKQAIGEVAATEEDTMGAEDER